MVPVSVCLLALKDEVIAEAVGALFPPLIAGDRAVFRQQIHDSGNIRMPAIILPQIKRRSTSLFVDVAVWLSARIR